MLPGWTRSSEARGARTGVPERDGQQVWPGRPAAGSTGQSLAEEVQPLAGHCLPSEGMMEGGLHKSGCRAGCSEGVIGGGLL